MSRGSLQLMCLALRMIRRLSNFAFCRVGISFYKLELPAREHSWVVFETYRRLLATATPRPYLGYPKALPR